MAGAKGLGRGGGGGGTETQELCVGKMYGEYRTADPEIGLSFPKQPES
jgi:hypothetical protein